MLKYIIICLMLFFGSLYSQNISKNTIGLRLGASDGFGTEISYQRALTDSNRLEFNLGWRSADTFDGLRLNGIYQWVWPLLENLNWYSGGGVGFSSFNFNDGGNQFVPGVLGNIGIEYNFDFPLLISLDLRPGLNFNNTAETLDFDFGIGFRYQFN